MRKLTALGALVLVGILGVALAAPSPDVALPVPAITTVSHADAAIGRGGGSGSGEGKGTQVGSRIVSFFGGILIPIFFLAVAVTLGAASIQRNAGAAVTVLIAAFLVGAFLLTPDQVEAFFRSIYSFVL